PRVVDTLTIVGSNEIRGEFVPEQTLYRGYKRFHVALSGGEKIPFETRNAWARALKPENVREESGDNNFKSVLLAVLPWIVIGTIVYFVLIRPMRSAGGPAGVLSFGRSRARVYMKERVTTSFDDVAGIEEAKQEV